ncbi:hypothetical protein NHQ30_008303 [Ciborinia camelliae]|nr:hypothetical protein NHQ30_008303 [Ciborinia camelliae]
MAFIGGFNLCLPLEVPQTEDRRRALQNRGNAASMPPEQSQFQRGESMGSWSNVWQVAKCISMLLTRGEDYSTLGTGPPFTIQFSHPDINNNRPFETYGPTLKRAIELMRTKKGKDGMRYPTKRIYSEDVDRMLYWCLAVDTKIRPEPRQLLREILKIIKSRGEFAEGEKPVTQPAGKTKEQERKEQEKKEQEKKEQERKEQERKEKEIREKERIEQEKAIHRLRRPPPPRPVKIRRLRPLKKLRAYRIDT